ncbi:hypothetical protein ACMU_03555 [Actibacterium mucosum KCTC 23349]|uniref:Co-chaperone DjlA N-terminal domain-containing protein n=1 Tax=Actibacterium mucosum KCTC 23349 TaxID=1454373 RepID=A0A037ZF55_9RHOB|nr:TerB family tellurite resistance protein [Actibacterium mucosum]KAJ54171.1 hypothetical protein ACMU_03555 [Actibacterium mucosum KCTC 23349]
MFRDLLNRLSGPEPSALAPSDTQLALGALLVRLAKSDDEYAVEEISQIDSILSARFDLNQVEAARLRAEAEKMEAEAPRTEDFAASLKDVIAYAERSAIVAAMWEIVTADGRMRDDEKMLFEKAAHTFGVDPSDLER